MIKQFTGSGKLLWLKKKIRLGHSICIQKHRSFGFYIATHHKKRVWALKKIWNVQFTEIQKEEMLISTFISIQYVTDTMSCLHLFLAALTICHTTTRNPISDIFLWQSLSKIKNKHYRVFSSFTLPALLPSDLKKSFLLPKPRTITSNNHTRTSTSMNSRIKGLRY